MENNIIYMCPECKENINFLSFEGTAQAFGNLRFGEDDYLDVDDYDNVEGTFFCPLCYFEFGKDEEKIQELIRNTGVFKL